MDAQLSDSHAERPEGRADWIAVAAACLALAVSSGPLLQFCFAVFLQPVSNALAVDRASLSFGLAAGVALSGLLTPFVGYLMDRYGVRLVALPTIPFAALSFASIGLLTKSANSFVLLYALTGVATAAFTPLPFAKAISIRFDRRRGLALGLATVGIGIGAAVLPQIVSRLIASVGWRYAYVGVAALVLVVALPMAWVALSPGKHSRLKSSIVHSGLTAREALRTSAFWKFAFAFFVMALACNGTIAHVVTLLTDRGVARVSAVAALSLAGLMFIVGRLVSGFLLDRLPPLRVAAVFFVIPAAGLALVLATHSQLLATVGVMLIGVGLGAEVNMIAFMIALYFGQRSFGTIYGYLFLLFTLGSATGPLLMGLSSRYGSYETAIMLFIAALVAGAITILQVGSPDLIADKDREPVLGS